MLAPVSAEHESAEYPDQELGRRAGQGDASAFDCLVRRWQDRLYRFLLARLGNRADAQDALQDAFVAAWRYRASYRERYEYSTWLYRIALREAARARQRPDDRAEPAPAAAPTGAEDGKSLWRLVRRYLSDSAFTVLWLRYHEDWTVKEISLCLRRPAAWVRLSLHRSRRRLAALLETSQ